MVESGTGSAGRGVTTRRRPVRGLVGGLVFGVGLDLMLIVLGLAGFSTTVPFVVIVVVCVAIGVALGVIRHALW